MERSGTPDSPVSGAERRKRARIIWKNSCTVKSLFMQFDVVSEKVYKYTVNLFALKLPANR
jgi:hypothetical protein